MPVTWAYTFEDDCGPGSVAHIAGRLEAPSDNDLLLCSKRRKIGALSVVSLHYLKLQHSALLPGAPVRARRSPFD